VVDDRVSWSMWHLYHDVEDTHALCGHAWVDREIMLEVVFYTSVDWDICDQCKDHPRAQLALLGKIDTGKDA
jgi:hypothetical protein